MTKKKGRKGKPKSGVFISQLGGLTEEQHSQLKSALLVSASKKVAEGADDLEALKAVFRLCDPLQILATCASYGLQGVVTENGVQEMVKSSQLEQFHVELLQAIILTIPQSDWGHAPAMPSDVQVAFDNVRSVAETFLASRLLAHQNTEDVQERTAQSLAEHIRLHTHVVRNWAYFEDVISISSELYEPLDSLLRDKASFTPTELIRIGVFLTTEWEKRLNNRFKILRRIARNKSARQIIRSYFKEVPDLAGTPDELFAILPKGVSASEAFRYVLSHFDLRLRDAAVFTAVQVAEGSGISVIAAEAALKFLSLSAGHLESHKFEHVHLDNPVSQAPAIELESGFFISMPQVIFTNIHPIIRRLCEIHGTTSALDRARATFLERKVFEAFKAKFPGARIAPNLKWEKDSTQYETDLFLVIDEIALIVEVKSHQLTPPALRGAAKRLKRHVDDLILGPSVQSLRLQNAIYEARSGDNTSREVCARLDIDPATVRRVIRLSISLEDFSIISSSEVELKAAGWLPKDHPIAPVISLADLIYLTDILSPPYFLHYLVQRERIQPDFDLTADEMDFLGMYLETLLNIGKPEKLPSKIVFTGMSSVVDHYYMSRDAGVAVPKPAPKVVPYFRKLIDRIEARGRTGWSTLSLILLDSASPDEQRKIVNGMERVKNSVRKKFREKGHLCCLQITPPQETRPGLIFYIYPDALKEQRVETMQQLAAEFFESSGRKQALVVGRCLERWAQPYDTIGLLEESLESDDGELVVVTE